MRGGDASLTQRRGGYPKPSQSTFLDLPTGEEDDRAAAFTSPPGKKHDQAPLRKGGRHEPWLVRQIEAFSKASVYTKATYGWVLVSLAVAWMGFRGIRHGHASVWLTCGATSCDLEITPPGPPKVTRVTILREQLVRSEAVKADPDGNVVRVLEGTAAAGVLPHRYAAKKKKKGKNPRYDVGDKGPDEDGNYDSYVLVASEFGPGKANDDDDGVTQGTEAKNEQKKPPRTGWHPTNSLEPLSRIVQPNEAGEYIIQMRRFNLGQSRRKALTTVTRINSYIRNRRHKLQIRETRHVAWQAIVAIVLGIFSLILSLLCGQFWEPEPIHHRVGGPGMRAGEGGRPPPRRAPPANPGLHGIRQDRSRQSGYGNYGGYSPQKRSY